MAQSLFKANFANVTPWDGTKGGVNDPEPGVYEVKVDEVAPHAKGERKSVKFTVGGPFGQTDLYLGLDFSKEANKRKMMTALASVGAKPEKIAAAGDLDVTDAHFVGKKAFIIVKANEGVDDLGRKKLNDKEFLTPEQYAAAKANGGKPAAAKANSGTAPAASAPAADPVAGLFGEG